MKLRLGYIVQVKSDLIEKLRAEGNDLHDYFSENYILTTEEHEYDNAFDGWKRKISDCAKNTFINESVLSLDFSNKEMNSIFGEYDSNIKLFDKWWELKEAVCEIIPTTWLSA